ncbi:two-component sensor histidine kinase [Metapseudomonas resinovorans]|uniref:sensor histidine kinase n=1 Tax=Metapseudomonas resinovorans TaxID=53412 RepID=UPI0009858CA0|nr:PAS domain-containing sensor histidine kinase [Pseudomonas resinovorans]GLZ87428.1 two-component sensor histidine kinase [Pseudomonas resinovorans]
MNAAIWEAFGDTKEEREIAPTQPFNLLRWFSAISLVIIATVAFAIGTISTHFLVSESLERDAMLSAQFIQTLAKGETRHHGLRGMQMGDILLPDQYWIFTHEARQNRERARSEFLDHLSHLPDSLLATIYGPDRTVVWSTNPALIGLQMAADDALEAAYESGGQVSARYNEVDEGRVEQKFLRAPNMFFIENYIPLIDDDGKVLAIVELYKEPVDLLERVKRGNRLIWTATVLGGLLIYLGLFWIVKRASNLLASQQNQLVANRTYVGLGEMSSAVAHSLRNPLASIRSSAELAQEMEGPQIQKCIADIISQVDRMSNWVRDLLLCLRPLHGESEQVEPIEVVKETLHNFDQQLTKAKIHVSLVDKPAPLVTSHKLLLSQVLNSVIANAIEAMPGGGQLSIQAFPDASGQWMDLMISDSGKGMSRQQELMAFKSFYTTKQGGLGIGLIMVKQIMERFGGKVSLTSREKEGTSVRLSFMIAELKETSSELTHGPANQAECVA